MEAMTGGDLFERLVEKKVYSEHETKIVIKKIVKAVKYLHDNGLVHRDLKPENMLLSSLYNNVDIKISDFGFSKKVEDGRLLTTPCGSPGYVAPEIANEQAYTTGVDMWSIGVTLYTMLAGYPPFYSEDSDILLEMVSEGNFEFPKEYWKNISNDATDLIKKLLEKNISKRFTAQQVLEHPWLKDKVKDKSTKNNSGVVKNQKSIKTSSDTWDFMQMRDALNKSIAMKRDGCILRSVTESSIFTRRRKKQLVAVAQADIFQ